MIYFKCFKCNNIINASRLIKLTDIPLLPNRCDKCEAYSGMFSKTFEHTIDAPIYSLVMKDIYHDSSPKDVIDLLLFLSKEGWVDYYPSEFIELLEYLEGFIDPKLTFISDRT